MAKECQLLVVWRHPACVVMDNLIVFVGVSEENHQIIASDVNHQIKSVTAKSCCMIRVPGQRPCVVIRYSKGVCCSLAARICYQSHWKTESCHLAPVTLLISVKCWLSMAFTRHNIAQQKIWQNYPWLNVDHSWGLGLDLVAFEQRKSNVLQKTDLPQTPQALLGFAYAKTWETGVCTVYACFKLFLKNRFTYTCDFL